jgi:hypothetical protein
MCDLRVMTRFAATFHRPTDRTHSLVTLNEKSVVGMRRGSEPVRRAERGIGQRAGGPLTPPARALSMRWNRAGGLLLVVQGDSEQRIAARCRFCLATVPTGADEAADRRLKFYELRDNIVRFPEWQQAG